MTSGKLNSSRSKSRPKVDKIISDSDDPSTKNVELEAKAVKPRKPRVNKDSKKRQSKAKMAKFSQPIWEETLSVSPKCGTHFKIPKLSKLGRLTRMDNHQGQFSDFTKDKSMDDVLVAEDFENVSDYSIDLDELLKQPDQPEDGTNTLDEVMDEIDRDIMERQDKHFREMEVLEKDIAAERERKEEAKLRSKRNAELRDRLEVEVTESVVKDLFYKNKDYLERVWSGKIESLRHKAYQKGIRTRQALYYTMITDPFTDDQLKWTLDHISEVWMRNKKEQMDNNEYVWKVLLPECFIKFYMDHFGLDKVNAERRISETPLKKGKDDHSSDENGDEF